MSKFTQVLKTADKPGVQARIKNALDEQSYADFQKAIIDPDIKVAAIGRALKELGVEVAIVSLQRMRTKQ